MTAPAQSPEARAHVLRAREIKRCEAEAIGVDERFISDMVDGFYAAIRTDDLLGPIFAARVSDWPPHLARMKQFWRSILHNSGEFSGNPMARHIAIPGLERRHFIRWLELFYANLQQMAQDPRSSEHVGKRARMIAESLLTGINVARDGVAGAMTKEALPHV
ncbi:group III truncated hemoglobin [Porphyrobacter sp. ULC335]|uniref:group III truncated hemoglobin n=1 Tax=Porphyrobacter sp. ULC335 TaxID=2854260 RepID=UPI00221FB09D|nr:group III truncated hemoglobin [Porphyrobacter sp. ULC335]UYV17221.1 group III truncated hemoglobin [Porphyrobacter sp. ULC335]